MSLTKIFVLAILLVGVKCRYLYEEKHPYHQANGNAHEDGVQDIESEEPFEMARPRSLRVRRHLHADMSTNTVGSTNIMWKLPVSGNGRNSCNRTVASTSEPRTGGNSAPGGGMEYDIVTGLEPRVGGSHVPGNGNQLTAAGRENSAEDHTHEHNLAANASINRNMPNEGGKHGTVSNVKPKGGYHEYLLRTGHGPRLAGSHSPSIANLTACQVNMLRMIKHNLTANARGNVPKFYINSKWVSSDDLNRQGSSAAMEIYGKHDIPTMASIFQESKARALDNEKTMATVSYLATASDNAIAKIEPLESSSFFLSRNGGLTRSLSPFTSRGSWHPGRALKG